jgi:Zn-dependent M32 family carboxypeptidase
VGCSAIGFDYDKGRMDTSVHPFTGGSHPTDVRITTRYSKDNWLEGIAGTVHEVRYIHIHMDSQQDTWSHRRVCRRSNLCFSSVAHRRVTIKWVI